MHNNTGEEQRIRCLGCKHLYTRTDGTGGGMYLCEKYPGLVLGEYGFWMSEDDEPMGSTKCYEPAILKC